MQKKEKCADYENQNFILFSIITQIRYTSIHY